MGWITKLNNSYPWNEEIVERVLDVKTEVLFIQKNVTKNKIKRKDHKKAP
jgi:hypothetical protein